MASYSNSSTSTDNSTSQEVHLQKKETATVSYKSAIITFITAIIILVVTIFDFYPLGDNDEPTKAELIMQEQAKERKRQYANFMLAHKNALGIIDDWNQIKDPTEELAHVKFVSEEIERTLKKYSKVKLDKLRPVMDVVHKWHLAKLYNIQADMQMKKDTVSATSNLDKAINLMEYIKVTLDNSEDFTTYDMEYIETHRLDEKAVRTKITSLGLLLFLHPRNTKRKKSADALLLEFGGCSELKRMNTRHIRIRKGLGCSIV